MKFGNANLFKYLIAGALNTGVTYLLYLLLIQLIPYIWAYSLTFSVGVILGYLLNGRWVFKSSLQWRSMLSYPLAYAFNYAFGVVVLWLLVEQLTIPKEIAPLVVVVVSLPVMYLVTQTIFHTTKKNETKTEYQ